MHCQRFFLCLILNKPNSKPKCDNKAIEQGSYGSWKTWKVLEFYYGIFQDWKVLEKGHCMVLESSGNLFNLAKTYEVHGR